MASFLVTIALGPVQSLIGAARRTRDLWCGSWLLSEAARAAARALHEHQPGCLIFPCPDSADELKPQRNPGDAGNIANVLRAEIEAVDAAGVRRLCEEAKAAAATRLLDIANRARQELDGLLRGDVWDAQINDILETFTAGVEMPDGGYAAASRKLGATLAARKATRDFPRLGVGRGGRVGGRHRHAPNAFDGAGLPKSSLDGAMETVLRERPNGPNDKARRVLALARGEQLDALGVVKRVGGAPEQFTAYPRIAADPWIHRLDADQRQRLCAAYEPLVGEEATRTTGNHRAYAEFPYDAQLLFPFRLENALGEAQRSESRKRLDVLDRCLKDIVRASGSPVPYAAILKADGDRMGRLLAEAKTADESREVSRGLHGFASSVRGTVRTWRGHAIYAGGDDVLALVPLPGAQDCARALAGDFWARMSPLACQMGLPAASVPTLSVGIGIGHIMEPLGALRDRAERAERLAKGDTAEQPRNALAAILGVRGGDEIAWRARWDDDKAHDFLRVFTKAYAADKLPSRVAYDTRDIARRLNWLDDCPAADEMRAAEVRRMLDRARAGGERIGRELAGRIASESKRRPLAKVADTLILARWLAARKDNDSGGRS